MSNEQRLKELWRPVASAVRSDEELRRIRATTIAINRDGSVNPDAIATGLPWQRADFRVPGAVATGTDRGGAIDMPQGGQIARIFACARTAPTTAPFTATITGATESVVISIPKGASSNATGADLAVPPGSVLRLDITSAGGASDVTVTIHYSTGGA